MAHINLTSPGDRCFLVSGRVRGWRGAFRVRCVVRRFRGGAQSDFHEPVSTPCPPNRTCGFPASGSPVGSCTSHAERRFGVNTHGPDGFACPGFQKLHGFTRAVSLAVAPPGLFTPRRYRATIRPGSFAYACDASELSTPSRGVRRQSHSRRPSSLRHPPHLRPLSSTGITPRLQYYEPLRHPVGPACPSRGPGCRVHGTGRASRVATLSIFHACRRHYPGGHRPVLASLASQPVSGLPLFSGGSTSAMPFSRPAQRSLAFRPAWSPSRPRRPSTRVLQSMSSPP